MNFHNTFPNSLYHMFNYIVCYWQSKFVLKLFNWKHKHELGWLFKHVCYLSSKKNRTYYPYLCAYIVCYLISDTLGEGGGVNINANQLLKVKFFSPLVSEVLKKFSLSNEELRLEIKYCLLLTSLITASVLMQLTSTNEKNMSQIIRKYITKVFMSGLGKQNLSYSLVYEVISKIKVNVNISLSY